MPFHRERYPADWRATSLRIRERAGQACECRGECGDEHDQECTDDPRRCSAPNGKLIKRSDVCPARWEEHAGCSLCLGGDKDCRPIRVVLTVAHLNHEPMDCRPENLKAMCQRCHLRYDGKLHARSARATRRARLAVGDLPGVS